MKSAVRNGDEKDEKTLATAVTIATSLSVKKAEAITIRRSSGTWTQRNAIVAKKASDHGSRA